MENHVEVTLSSASSSKKRRSKQKQQNHQKSQQQQEQQQQQQEQVEQHFDNEENITPNVSTLPTARRSNRISDRTKNQSLLRSTVVEEPRFVKRSRKTATFEESKLINPDK